MSIDAPGRGPFITSSSHALRARLEIAVQTVVESTWSAISSVLASSASTTQSAEQAFALLDQLDVVLEEASERQVWTGRYPVRMPLHLRAELVRLVGIVATDLRNELRVVLTRAGSAPTHERRALLERLYVLLDGGERTEPPQSGGLKHFIGQAERHGLAPSPTPVLLPEEREHFAAVVRRVILEIQDEQRSRLVAGPAVSALREQVAHLRQIWTLSDDLLFEILRAHKRNLVDAAFVRAVTQSTWTIEPVNGEEFEVPAIDLVLAGSGMRVALAAPRPGRRESSRGYRRPLDEHDDDTHPSIPPVEP